MPDSTNLKPEFVIKLEGERVEPKVAADVQGIRVYQSRRQASSFEIILQNHQAKWSDADLFFDGREIEIELGYVGATEPVFKGEITAWRTELDRDAPSSLVVRGMDKSHRLMRGTKTRTYVEKTAPQIAQQIAGEYGLSPQVDSGGVQVKFRIQSNETDYVFLRRLADTEGYEFWVDGDDLHFEVPQLGSKEGTAPVFVYGKSIKAFLPMADFRTPVKTVVGQAWNSDTQEDISATVEAGAQLMTLSGSDHGGEVASSALGDAKRHLTDLPAETKEQAERMAKTKLTQYGMSFLTGELEVRGDPKVLAGDVVKIEKCGQWFSGTYYVVDANHFYDPGGYETIAFLARDKWGEKSDAELEQEQKDAEAQGESEGTDEEGKVIFQQFVDQDQKPIPKVQFEVRDEGANKRVTAGTTGEDGIVQTRVKGEGPFKVLAVGQKGLTPSGGTVSGRVTSGGEPLADAAFLLRKGSEEADPVTDATLKGVTENTYEDGFWKTDADGWYRFTDMPGGKYFVEVVEVTADSQPGEDEAGEQDTQLGEQESEETEPEHEGGDRDEGGTDEGVAEPTVDVFGQFKVGSEALKFVPFALHKGAEDGPKVTPDNLEGATEMQWTDGHWATDGQGNYLFKGMPPGKYFVEILNEEGEGETTAGGNESGWEPPPDTEN